MRRQWNTVSETAETEYYIPKNHLTFLQQCRVIPQSAQKTENSLMQIQSYHLLKLCMPS